MVKSRVQFWFKDLSNPYLQIPVNPEYIDFSSPYGINTVSIARLGEVAIPGERGLKQISFSSFFPRDYNPSYCEYEGFLTPWNWVAKIEAWRDERKSVRLIIPSTKINIPVYISEFTLQPEKAGAPGDIYYSITLIEHRPITTKVLTKPTSKTAATTEKETTTTQPKSKSHTVVRGDTLFKIAKEQYKDGSQWRKIYDANKKTIGKDPNKIKAGQKLVIP